MPLDIRPIAITIAVITFFGFGIMGAVNGLESFICCKRAVTGAIAAYIVTSLAIKAVNAIIMDAIIKEQISKQMKENRSNDNTN